MHDSQHVVCVKSSMVYGENNAFIDYTLSTKDILLCERGVAEHDSDFLKVVPTAVILYDGKLWAFKNTLKGQVSAAIVSELGITDLIVKDSNIDLDESFDTFFSKQLDCKLELDSYIVKQDVLPKLICSDFYPDNRPCLLHAHVYHLDGPHIQSVLNDIEVLGFLSPEELLSDSFETDMTTMHICRAILDNKFNR
ncbi:hypothetical protein [Alteromonas gracilis]|uniref:hypothetical protein n=1 Tax=Alteromonas gracilis TaxID=1479524 RepID=UPI0037354E35